MLHDRLNCSNIKKAALMAALDITLKRMHRSPQRCARNIMELGISAFPNKLSEADKAVLTPALLEACKHQDAVLAKELFCNSFLL